MRALHDLARFGGSREAASAMASLRAEGDSLPGASAERHVGTAASGPPEGHAAPGAGAEGHAGTAASGPAEGHAAPGAGAEGHAGTAASGPAEGDARPGAGAERLAAGGPATVAAHVEALARRDGRALVAVAEAFAAADALLVAAEAARAAAETFAAGGRDASARAAARRAAVLLESCEGARPPTLPPEHDADELTRREREVALMAAAGLTSRQIAERLVVSVRTVDNHLQRAYRKLGISRREDLARLFARDAA